MGWFRDLPPHDPTARPRLEHRGPLWRQLVLVDEIGAEWRVLDIAAGETKPTRAPRQRAIVRLFLYRDGTVRCYTFARHERRDIDPFNPERVHHQLLEARVVRMGTAGREVTAPPAPAPPA